MEKSENSKYENILSFSNIFWLKMNKNHQKMTTIKIFEFNDFFIKSRFCRSCGRKVEISQDVVDEF
jgi:hypothetical protein